jgi:predicted nucleic acid-binding protein
LILVDSSGLLAVIDSRQRSHASAERAMNSSAPPLVLSPFVLAELDYFLTTRVGLRQELALLADVARGAYRLEPFSAMDIDRAHGVIERYQDLNIGLADASIVVLAERHGVRDVLTLDRRHFSALRTPSGQRFKILPAQAT